MTRTTNENRSATAATSDKWEASRRRRGPSCLSDLTLDRLLTGELVGHEAAVASGHLALCGACAEARAGLALAREQFLSQQNLPALAADALARASAAPLTGASRWRAVLAVVTLAAGAAGALLLFRAGDATTNGGAVIDGDGDRRSKGSLSLGVFVQHPEQAGQGRLHLGEPLHAGDKLRFSIRSDRAGHVAVLGIDAAGTVTVYHPQGGAAKAVPLAARSDAPLDSAVELDDTPGDELVVAVRCDEALPVDQIVAAARKAAGAAGGGEGGALSLPCAEARYRIHKVGRERRP